MSKISTYPIDSNVNVNDYIIGTDSDNNSITKNYTISSIIALSPYGGMAYINAVDTAGTSVTTFASQDIYYPLETVLTSQIASGWTVDDTETNRIVYGNSAVKPATITFTVNCKGTAGDVIDFAMYKNGTEISGTEQKTEIPSTSTIPAILTIQTLQSLAVNDYFEVYAKNTSGTDSITTTHLNVVVHTL